MTESKTHPHVVMPSEAELADVILGIHPAHHDLYVQTHRLALDAVPGVRHAIDLVDGGVGYGAHQFGYDGWGMAALVPHKNWVSVVFFRGAVLEDPDGLLEGTGASVRHVKLRSVDDLVARRGALVRLLKTAAGLGHTQTSAR